MSASFAELEARLDAARIAARTRLPVQPTHFVGREREVVAVCELLGRADVRLVTLTGPGGIGKTRLAVEAAAHAARRHADGASFAALASIRDAAFLAATIVEALGLAEQPGVAPERVLFDHLAPRESLLVLDNLEQLADRGAAFVSRLLAEAPRLTVLAVSREPLHLAAEHAYAVLPLDDGDAVALFLERARAARPGFSFDPAVVEICRRLDALPLAIELAAARVRALAPAEILRRLDRRLPLLTDGPRDVPERQRTLRAAIDWSHELMAPDEQALFARLGVFVGGFTLDAAEQIGDGDLDTLQALVDKSLVRFTGNRYDMLETIREYAGEQLEGRGETQARSARHADWFLERAERAAPELRRDQSDRIWLDALEADRDNTRAALRWYIDRERGEEAQRLAAALCAFWHDRGPAGEACDWIGQALALPGPDATRAALLTRGSVVAAWGAQSARGVAWAAEGLPLAREHGDRLGVVVGLTTLAVRAAGDQRRTESAALLDEALAVARESGDDWAIGVTLVTILTTDVDLDIDRARAMAHEAAGLRHVSAAARAMIEMCRGFVAEQSGADDEAISLYRDSIALAREIGFDRACAPLLNLGFLHLRRGERQEARELLHEAVDRAMATGALGMVAAGIAYMAVLADADGDPLRAATLRGAVERHREDSGEVPLTEFLDGTFDGFLAEARARAGASAWGASFEQGRAMSLADAAGLVGSDRPRFDPRTAADGTLTIMFSDIVGSTAMNERLGDRRWLEILRAHDAIVCREVELHRGGVVKSRGDGFMLAFARARDAVSCAVAIQRAFADYNAFQTDAPIRVRIGLHTGTAIAHDNDYYGRDVNLAARIADQAAGDEILVTAAVSGAFDEGLPFELVPGAPLELKGLSGHHTAYSVVWDAGRAGATGSATSAAAS